MEPLLGAFLARVDCLCWDTHFPALTSDGLWISVAHSRFGLCFHVSFWSFLAPSTLQRRSHMRYQHTARNIPCASKKLVGCRGVRACCETGVAPHDGNSMGDVSDQQRKRTQNRARKPTADVCFGFSLSPFFFVGKTEVSWLVRFCELLFFGLQLSFWCLFVLFSHSSSVPLLLLISCRLETAVPLTCSLLLSLSHHAPRHPPFYTVMHVSSHVISPTHSSWLKVAAQKSEFHFSR